MNAIAEIGILVFREGLECILVLAAVTAGLRGGEKKYQRAVAGGVGLALIATVITWRIAVRILSDLSQRVSALSIQAATGLLAIVVLLLVMNWFFHKLYWTGWISLHNRRKQDLLSRSAKVGSVQRVMSGMALLGFTSFYREGFEVVLFLQSYRLKLGGDTVFYGAMLGVAGSGIVAIVTFVVHRRLPYRRMLVATGVLLGGVLLVMVGEEVQEMQLAQWLPITNLSGLTRVLPSWMGLWFSVFPTVETLSAQLLAGVLVVGSYFVTRIPKRKGSESSRVEGDQKGIA